jgi:hypothetical protein
MDKTSINVSAVADYIDKIEESIAIAQDIMQRPRRGRLHTLTTIVEKNQSIRPEISFIWTLKIYGCTSSKRASSAKFYPRFIGPFKVIDAKPRTSTYKLQLPPEYAVHPTFKSAKYARARTSRSERVSKRSYS